MTNHKAHLEYWRWSNTSHSVMRCSLAAGRALATRVASPPRPEALRPAGNGAALCAAATALCAAAAALWRERRSWSRRTPDAGGEMVAWRLAGAGGAGDAERARSRGERAPLPPHVPVSAREGRGIDVGRIETEGMCMC
ncbi:Os07g0169000 [Oryza sativa Japonica Group]|uniref:Os07g0169000 protein n=1 Tax=Oryza sativa subsp. japonica TaxID=39947 RepID=A0A0N7KMZ9_ORYSJ|nr:Os07g0169000 [Oryza sativa Japonica Group]